jgi:hypothetical protein
MQICPLSVSKKKNTFFIHIKITVYKPVTPQLVASPWITSNNPKEKTL